MFERYTEKARRVIVLALHEARQFGSPAITTEHLLLALFREDRGLLKSLVPGLTPEWTRHEIENHMPPENTFAQSNELPLSNSAERALAYAVEEAKRLGHKHIGCADPISLKQEKESLYSPLPEGAGKDMAE